MRIEGFTSVGDWKSAANQEGYLVPLPMCHGLSVIMKELGISFQEAFKILAKENKIILSGKAYVYDMSAHNAWLQEMKTFRKLIGPDLG